MGLDDAFRAGLDSLLARPSAVLPFYVAGLASRAIAQTVLLAGSVVAYLTVAGTGRLDRLEALLREVAPIHVDDPDALVGFERATVERAVEDVFTAEVLVVVGGSVVLALLLVLVVDAVISAGQLHAVYATIRGRPATRRAVAGAGRHWTTFVGLVVVEVFANVVAFGVPFVAVAVGSMGSGSIEVLAGLLAIVWFFALLPILVVLRLGFAFARPAAVVDDVGIAGAIRGGFGHLRAYPLGSLGYGILAIVVLVVLSLLGTLFGVLGQNPLTSVLVLVVAFPLLDLTKTVLYARAAEVSLSVPQIPAASGGRRIRRGLGDGVRALGGFARDSPWLVFASTGVFAGGIVLGLEIGGAVDHLLVASIEQRIRQLGPVSALLAYAANNWSVMTAQAFSGFAFGIPTLATLAFNGVNVGTLYALESQPTILLAFLLPHGIFEIPALLLSGALGLHLGGVGARAVFGSATRRDVADAVDRAFRISVGLAVLVGTAAVLEAFVSPYYWQFLGI